MPSLKNVKRAYMRHSFLRGITKRRHRNNALTMHRSAMKSMRRDRASRRRAANINAQIDRTLEDNMLFAEAEREATSPEEVEAIFAAKKRRAAYNRAAMIALNDNVSRLGL